MRFHRKDQQSEYLFKELLSTGKYLMNANKDFSEQSMSHVSKCEVQKAVAGLWPSSHSIYGTCFWPPLGLIDKTRTKIESTTLMPSSKMFI